MTHMMENIEIYIDPHINSLQHPIIMPNCEENDSGMPYICGKYYENSQVNILKDLGGYHEIFCS